MQAYCLRLDQARRDRLAAAAASTRLPAAELIRLGIDRLLEQIRQDGGLTLPVMRLPPADVPDVSGQ